MASPPAADPYAQFQPPRPARNPLRTASSPPPVDVLDGQIGAFQYDDDDDEGHEEFVDAEAPREDYDRIGAYRQEENYGGPTDFQFTSRSYDDEDAALQAALKASMDDLPEGWEAPKWEEKKLAVSPAPALATAPAPLAAPVLAEEMEAESTGAGSKFKEDLDDDDDDEPGEQLSAGRSAAWSIIQVADAQTRSEDVVWLDSGTDTREVVDNVCKYAITSGRQKPHMHVYRSARDSWVSSYKGTGDPS